MNFNIPARPQRLKCDSCGLSFIDHKSRNIHYSRYPNHRYLFDYGHNKNDVQLNLDQQSQPSLQQQEGHQDEIKNSELIEPFNEFEEPPPSSPPVVFCPLVPPLNIIDDIHAALHSGTYDDALFSSTYKVPDENVTTLPVRIP